MPTAHASSHEHARTESAATAMHYVSTRNAAASRTARSGDRARASRLTAACTFRSRFRTSCRISSMRLPTCLRSATQLLTPFAAGDPLPAEIGATSAARRSISRRRSCTRACASPASVLELFHGPTAAFKDFGARFLAASLAAHPARRSREADDPRGDLRRHRRRGGRGVSSTGPESMSSCCIRRARCHRARRSSSRAGAATCARSACAARSMIASGW